MKKKYTISSSDIIRMAEFSQQNKDYLQKLYPDAFGLKTIFFVINDSEGVLEITEYDYYRFECHLIDMHEFISECKTYGNNIIKMNSMHLRPSNGRRNN